ncbi:hypothetical protein [uncultured Rikenella sp.]|uniref:hypothetical protein n=1 Tax=uncultured Rikenella sp. TaxID=368003 RepID=UPI0026145819|nr:hypothetical protein [uncultured Rikenella sp.]
MSDKVYPREMHTAEHILGGTMVRMFGCGRAVTTHLEKKKSKADFDFRNIGRNLTPAEAEEVVRIVNDQIDRHMAVTFQTIPYTEAAAEFDLSRLPETVAATPGTGLRIVCVGDYDRCPCIGEHVTNTSEIGHIRLISTDYDNDSGILRIRFKLDR